MKIIYISSSNEGMTEDDMICYIMNFKIIHPNLKYSFDEITGGSDDFIEKDIYEKLKLLFESIHGKQ